MTVVLTIAGSDSSGGAGIQADLKTFAAFAVYGATAVTAVTAQNTLGVSSTHEVGAAVVIAQIDAVLEDLGADGVKTGMLASRNTVSAVAERIRHWGLGDRLVVDPVVRASTGAGLMRGHGLERIVRELFPLARVVTPNVPEAEAIVGRSIRSVADARAAAREILTLGPRAVLVKGGHLQGPDAVDILVTADGDTDFAAPRIGTRAGHGGGCTLSAAIAARLALGDDLRSAVGAAKTYVTSALAHAEPIGRGRGPLAHTIDLRRVLELYLIADTGLVPPASLPVVVAAALAGGVTIVQLRAKGLTTREQLDLARELRTLCASRGVPFVVNDRVDVALAARADGVHVGHQGMEDISPADARRLLGPDAIVGVSVGSADEAARAEAAGATYVSAGPMFLTTTKADAGPAAGEPLLRAVRAAVTIPVVAIGGITAEHSDRLYAAGADGVCVAGAILRAADPTAAARAFQLVGAGSAA